MLTLACGTACRNALFLVGGGPSTADVTPATARNASREDQTGKRNHFIQRGSWNTRGAVAFGSPLNLRGRRLRCLYAQQLQCGHRFRLQIDYTDAMGVGVGHVQLAVAVAEASRLTKERARQPAVRLAAEEG